MLADVLTALLAVASICVPLLVAWFIVARGARIRSRQHDDQPHPGGPEGPSARRRPSDRHARMK